MRILVFSPYYPPHVGGLESHAKEWNFHMAEAGNTITVLTPQLPESGAEYEKEHERVEVLRFPAFEIIPNFPAPKFWSISFWRQWRRASKKKPDIVISRTRFFLTSLMAMWYAKTRRITWVHVEHGSDYVFLNSKLFTTLAKWYDHTFGRLVFLLADSIVANSKASAEFVKKIVPKTDPRVVYRGVPVDIILDAKPAEHLRSSTLTLVYVGRLIEGKGIFSLLDALQYINDPIRLLIVGDGPQKEALESVARKNTTHEIVFLGQQSFENAMSIVKVGDIAVIPSYNEGFGASVVEAALCKRAIVASNVGGIPEIITDQMSGYLVKPNDPIVLAERINNLINNPGMISQFGERAFRDTYERFHWEKSIDSYINMFKAHVPAR